MLAEAGAGLPEFRPSGLLLRRGSLTAGGDRERLSNLDVRFGSGSFWSKRERLTARLSVSSILNIETRKSKNVCAKGGAMRRIVDDEVTSYSWPGFEAEGNFDRHNVNPVVHPRF